jgi:hypothetical protein
MEPEAERLNAEFRKILTSVMEIGEIGVELVEQDKDFPGEAYTKFTRAISASIDDLVEAIKLVGKQ